MKNLFTVTGLALFAALNFGNVERSNANAFQQTQNEVTPSGYLNLTSMCSNDPAATRVWRVRNFTNAPVSYTWDVYNAGQNGSGVAQPGDSFFETVTVTVPGSSNTTRIFWSVEGTQYSKVKASGGAQCATPPPVVPCGTELIVNGNFEGGNTGFTSGYTFKVDGAANNELVLESTYGVGPNVATYHPQLVGTGRSGNYMMVNGNTLSTLTVWSQNVNVVAGKNYAFKAYAQNTFAVSPAVLRVYAGTELLGTFSPEGLTSWTEFTSTFTASSTGSIELRIVDSNLSKTGNDFGLDDLSLIEVCPELPTSCYAEQVISFTQGNKYDGISPVDAGRSIPTKALGAPEANDSENFVSLGFGGQITLKFGSAIKNGEGNDVRVVESTFGNIGCNRYPETIRAFASQDGCNFVFIGEGCQDTDFDLGILAWAQYIKLVDVSPLNAAYQGTPNGDAYDVDGIMCLNGYEANPVLAPAVVGASEVISYEPEPRKNGTPVPPARAIANNALGNPEGSNAVNFVALGFGGNIVLKFNYVIFDTPGNDLQIVETSYGNPSCASYPETAIIEGSFDNVTWVNLGTICQDGAIDIAAAGAIQYVRITDHSSPNSFSGSADGYDVDGVVILNNSCETASNTTARWADNTTTANEVTSAEVYPNPFSDNLNLVISTGDLDNTATVTVTNYLGKVISSERLNVSASSSIQHSMNVSDLSRGVYFISVETNTTKEVLKVVKQ